MSFTVTASAEELAKLFHHYQEALAGDLRVAAVRMALLELAETHDGQKRQYFATPGDAEWGC